MRSGLKIGQKASFGKTITESDVYGFAGLSGDFNPAHINQTEAEQGIFGKRVAHGFLVGSLISATIGMKLPGPGTIYMSQTMQFKRPVFFNDTVTATVEVTDIISREKGIYRLTTQVHNQDGVCVIEGEAVVKYI